MKLSLAYLVLLVAMPAIASSDDVSRGKALIERAQEKTNIFALPSFRMKANVRIDNFGKPLDGTYSLLWNGPDQWREEIAFPGYSETQVASKGVVNLKRSTDYLPYQIYQLHFTLGFSSWLNSTPQGSEEIKKIRDEKAGGQRITCIEIANEEKHTHQVCIDPATGLLNRSKQNVIQSDFLPVGSKVFPRSMARVQDGKTEVDIHVTGLDAGVAQAPGLFEPPPGAVSRPGCLNGTPPRAMKKVNPIYPMQEKMARRQGTVGLYALIDENGVPQDLRVVLSASPGLDSESLNAVRQWRYEPATCNGKPVAVETVVTVMYSLRY
jgi:TonB family protein